MKTTIDIPDSLLRQAKRLAAQQEITFKELIESALRDKLARAQAKSAPRTVTTHTFRGRGLQPGVSFDDWAAVRSMSYEGRGG
jgi:hypothetical protein